MVDSPWNNRSATREGTDSEASVSVKVPINPRDSNLRWVVPRVRVGDAKDLDLIEGSARLNPRSLGTSFSQ